MGIVLILIIKKTIKYRIIRLASANLIIFVNNMRRNIFKISIFSLIILVTSCNSKIPEGPIRDYIEGFSIKNALENINSVSLEYFNYEYDSKGEEIGKAYCYFEFDKTDEDNPYLYLYRTYEGTLIQDDGIKEKEVLQYIDSGKIYGCDITDDVRKDLKVDKTKINDSITSFFYKDNTYDYYRGGLYYGDLIKISAEKWHINFSINDDGLLRYTLVNDMTYEGVIFNTDYTVTKDGMLKNYYYDGIITETNEKIVNTIDIEYNVNLNKKESI